LVINYSDKLQVETYITLLQTLNDTTFNQKNADNIQKYVKKARKKVYCISAFVSLK
jgi:hypothetical protein